LVPVKAVFIAFQWEAFCYVLTGDTISLTLLSLGV
jgi:hypothetical protein